jgi:hypothetical protein
MMKKSQLLFIALIIAFGVASAQSSKSVRYLKPSGFTKRVTTQISGKSASYYSLSADEVSMITLKGPGVLKVITRGRITPETGSVLSYELLYSVDGEPQQSKVFKNVSKSKMADYQKKSLGKPAESRSFEIELGRGDHSIDFLLQDKNIMVAARYIFKPAKVKKRKWISFNPVQPAEPVELITRESVGTYYRCSSENPLVVEVIGPTVVRVLTRTENHYNMRGLINYRMQVLENGKVINTYLLGSRRSQVTVYADNNELVPGRACEFIIDVPKGVHTYQIMPLDKDKSTVLGRFLIPRADVKLVK